MTSVSVNPSAVCSVSIVPTRDGSASSAIDAENCAESATMLMPQTTHTATSAHAGSPPNSKPDRRGAAAADRHRDDGERRAPEAVGEKARADAADRARPRWSRTPRAWPRSRRVAGGQRQREARVEEHADPRPHRVELPHVAEIAQIGEPQRHVAPRRRAHRADRSAARRAVGADAGEADQHRGGERAHRRQRRAECASRRRPSALNRCGDAEPSVSAPTRMPTISPMSPFAQVAASFMPTG